MARLPLTSRTCRDAPGTRARRPVLLVAAFLLAPLSLLAQARSASPDEPATARQKAAPVASGATTSAGLPQWRPVDGVTLGPTSRSLEVLENDLAITFAPVERAPRRGSAEIGARLPVFGWAPRSERCAGGWYLVGPEAWTCASDVRPSRWPASTETRVQPGSDGLPHRYHFVGRDGSFGYATLRLAEEGVPDSQLEPGFAVALRRVQHKPGGEAYGLTTHGLWLPMRDLHPARPTRFRGTRLTPQSRDVAWTFRESTRLYTAPHRSSTETLPRHQQLQVLEQERAGATSWLKVGDSLWVRASDVRRLQIIEAPKDLLPGERWLAVDTERQVLVAYEGEQPVFATLVSTGQGTDGTPFATPKGLHRIWVKLVTTDMTNLEQQEANRYYAIEEVPWVMFFNAGYGLHGAFWHDSFGTRRSHGCVNLSPWDAHFLFEWAGPQLPAGWRAVHPTTYDRGTLVVVH